MNPSELQSRVYRMIHDLTAVPVDQIHPTDHLIADLGMDSVAQMELIGMFQEELSIEVDLEDTFAVQTVQQVIDLAQRCLDRAA